jgi:DNA-directed RNA polymerase specialized sigma24 family protein
MGTCKVKTALTEIPSEQLEVVAVKYIEDFSAGDHVT